MALPHITVAPAATKRQKRNNLLAIAIHTTSDRDTRRLPVRPPTLPQQEQGLTGATILSMSAQRFFWLFWILAASAASYITKVLLQITEKNSRGLTMKSLKEEFLT
jgi:hypothetical protein